MRPFRTLRFFNDSSSFLFFDPDKLTISLTISDLWDWQSDIDWLKNKVGPLQGSKQSLKISFANFTIPQELWRSCGTVYTGGFCDPWTAAVPLDIEVQGFVPQSDNGDDYSLDLLHYDEQVVSSMRPAYCVIPAGKLPSLDTLENWAMETSRCHRRAFMGGFRGSFLSFATRYADSPKDLPMVG